VAQEAVQERRLPPAPRFSRDRQQAPSALKQPSVETDNEPNYLARLSDPFQGRVSAAFEAVSVRTIMLFLGFDTC
jgi:hypothetical protein